MERRMSPRLAARRRQGDGSVLAAATERQRDRTELDRGRFSATKQLAARETGAARVRPAQIAGVVTILGAIGVGLRALGIDEAPLVCFLASGALAALMTPFCAPMPQNKEYHKFADRRALIPGVPNTMDVLSNFPFLIIGVSGLAKIYEPTEAIADLIVQGPPIFASDWDWMPWAVFFAAVACVSFGSAYYHLKPTNARLVWDRLPMAVGFSALFMIMVAERVSLAAAQALFWPTVGASVASVAYWAAFDDLRPYFFVQFFPLLSMPLLLAGFRGEFSDAGYYTIGGILYVLAKVTEDLDRSFYRASKHVVGGHALKHLFAAGSCAVFLAMLSLRLPIADGA